MLIQSAVNEWFKRKGQKYWDPLEILVRLTEEVGEVAREVNPQKTSGDLEKLEIELGDVLFTVGALANRLNLDLEKGFQEALNKG